MNNLILINETLTNGFTYNSLDIVCLSATLSGILVIISKNPIISVLFLIILFASISSYLIIISLSFIGFSYLIVYIEAVSLLLLFLLIFTQITTSKLQSMTSYITTSTSTIALFNIIVILSISLFQLFSVLIISCLVIVYLGAITTKVFSCLGLVGGLCIIINSIAYFSYLIYNGLPSKNNYYNDLEESSIYVFAWIFSGILFVICIWITCHDTSLVSFFQTYLYNFSLYSEISISCIAVIVILLYIYNSYAKYGSFIVLFDNLRSFFNENEGTIIVLWSLLFKLTGLFLFIYIGIFSDLGHGSIKLFIENDMKANLGKDFSPKSIIGVLTLILWGGGGG